MSAFSFSPHPRSLFIVFEGPHASGKSYYARSLVRRMRQYGYDSIYSKEPYSKVLNNLIKMVSKRQYNDPYALFSLITSDRFLHLVEIEKNLKKNITVVSDRYIQSTLVYQRMQGVPLSLINRVNELMPSPDLLFYIDTPRKIRSGRMVQRRRASKDLFYDEGMLRLEDRYYENLKSTLIRRPNAMVVNGQSKEEKDRVLEIVLGRLS